MPGPARFGIALATALAAAALAACSGDSADSADSPQTVTLKMTDQLRFEPGEIRVKAGQLVEMKIDNSKGGVLHDFAVDKIPVGSVHHEAGAAHNMQGADPDLHLAVGAKKRGMLEFTPLEPGEYEFHCTVLGHAQAGMRGTIIVEA